MTANNDTNAVSYLILQAGSSVPCGMGPRKVKLDTYRKRSVVWSFFRDTDSGSVQCVLCNRYLHKQEHGSTTPMLRHLRLKHPTQVLRDMETENEAAASHQPQDMEIDGDQIISVVVALDDESNTKTSEKDSAPSPAVDGLFEASQQGSLIHPALKDDHISNRHSRRRSLIWRLFEHLDNLNAARCRICLKKLHKSGGISNLRRHLIKRHPNVLSELLSQCPAVSSQDLNVASVSHESHYGAEPHQAPVKLFLEDEESHILTRLSETNDQDTPQVESAEKSTETEGSNADGGTGETMWDSSQKWIPVEVRMEDFNAGVMTPNKPDTINVTNEDLSPLQEGLTQDAKHSEGMDSSSEKPPTKGRRRSIIWKHFDRLENSETAQCRICKSKLQCFESGCTSNLHRHLSKKHPNVFSDQSPYLNSHGGTTKSLLRKLKESPVRQSLPAAGLKVSKQPKVEIRVAERELELIEALRRTQREEAQALRQQRELIEKLQKISEREAAAEREKIELLRKAQQEEAEELSRQREELERGKAELQKNWEELHRKREEFVLLSKSKEDDTEVTG